MNQGDYARARRALSRVDIHLRHAIARHAYQSFPQVRRGPKKTLFSFLNLSSSSHSHTPTLFPYYLIVFSVSPEIRDLSSSHCRHLKTAFHPRPLIRYNQNYATLSGLGPMDRIDTRGGASLTPGYDIQPLRGIVHRDFRHSL